MSAHESSQPAAPAKSSPSDEERPEIPAGRKLIYGLVAATLLLALGEGVLRVEYRLRHGTWDFGKRYDPTRRQQLYVAHPFLGFMLNPNATSISRYRGDEKIVTINAQGFRGAAVASPKPRGTFRVACVGGSTTFGTGTSSDETAWPALLGDMLSEARPGRAIDVVNAGCPGYTTVESLINYQLRVCELEPDLVIVMHAFNDLAALSMPGLKADYAHYRDPSERFDPDVGFTFPALRHSIIFLKLRRKLVRAEKDGAMTGKARAASAADDVAPEAIRIYERNIRSLVAAIQSGGVRPMLITFPRPYDLDSTLPPEVVEHLRIDRPYLTWQGLERGLQRCDATMRSIAEDEGVLLGEIAAAVGTDLALFPDFVHVNDRGSAMMARAIADTILASGVLEVGD